MALLASVGVHSASPAQHMLIYASGDLLSSTGPWSFRFSGSVSANTFSGLQAVNFKLWPHSHMSCCPCIASPPCPHHPQLLPSWFPTLLISLLYTCGGTEPYSFPRYSLKLFNVSKDREAGIYWVSRLEREHCYARRNSGCRQTVISPISVTHLPQTCPYLLCFSISSKNKFWSRLLLESQGLAKCPSSKIVPLQIGKKSHQGNIWTWKLSYKHLFISS